MTSLVVDIGVGSFYICTHKRKAMQRILRLERFLNYEQSLFFSKCCGWVPCFLVSHPLRSRDEFLLLYGVTRCISWSDFHEVTTFLKLDNVYILVCTDCLVFSTYSDPWLYGLVCFVQINASLQVDLHLTLSTSSETLETQK